MQFRPRRNLDQDRPIAAQFASRATEARYWAPPPSQPVIESGEFHVWRYSLDGDPVVQSHFYGILSPDEQARAERFHFAVHRSRYIYAQASARLILGWYLGLNPAGLYFNRNPYGKPTLVNAPFDLRFNISDSGVCGLLGVALGREVGVDVEQIRTEMEHLETANHYFSPSEVKSLQAVPIESRVFSFFDCWTRKEAYIKAKGRGLSIPLDAFDVSLGPGEPARLLRSLDEADDREGWSFWGLDPLPGFVAAVAAPGAGWRLSTFDASARWLSAVARHSDALTSILHGIE